jgi:hypothetical protein
MFLPTWTDVRAQLCKGDVIRYWGPFRGFSYGTFVLTGIGADRLSLTTKKGVPLEVRKTDFEKTAPLLDAYATGQIKSTDILNTSGRSAYIFSIVHDLRERAARPQETIGDLLEKGSRVYLKSEYGPVSEKWPAVSFSSDIYARQLGAAFDAEKDLIIFAGTQKEPTPEVERGRLLCAMRVFSSEPIDSGLLVDARALADFQNGDEKKYAYSLQLKDAWTISSLPPAKDYVSESYRVIGLGEARRSYLELSPTEIERLRALPIEKLAFAITPLEDLEINGWEEDGLERQLNRMLALLVNRAQSGGKPSLRIAPIREVHLTKNDLRALWKRQSGICALCDKQIPVKTSNFLMQVSADRIDSGVPIYNLENTQLAHLGCNYGKNSASVVQFGEWMSMIRS